MGTRLNSPWLQPLSAPLPAPRHSQGHPEAGSAARGRPRGGGSEPGPAPPRRGCRSVRRGALGAAGAPGSRGGRRASTPLWAPAAGPPFVPAARGRALDAAQPRRNKRASPLGGEALCCGRSACISLTLTCPTGRCAACSLHWEAGVEVLYCCPGQPQRCAAARAASCRQQMSP